MLEWLVGVANPRAKLGTDLRPPLPPKRDWQQIGRELRDEVLARRKQGNALLQQFPPPDFENAVIAYIEGDASKLIAYLRSDRPLDRDDREALAWWLEYSLKPKAGRPPNNALKDMAELAEHFYREWKARNKREGINDRGLSENMKYQSCVYLLEMQIEDGGDTPETIMQMLNRPKSRRTLKS
jgi:hypothetical protein